jgi:hypothetical protein
MKQLITFLIALMASVPIFGQVELTFMDFDDLIALSNYKTAPQVLDEMGFIELGSDTSYTYNNLKKQLNCDSVYSIIDVIKSKERRFDLEKNFGSYQMLETIKVEYYSITGPHSPIIKLVSERLYGNDNCRKKIKLKGKINHKLELFTDDDERTRRLKTQLITNAIYQETTTGNYTIATRIYHYKTYQNSEGWYTHKIGLIWSENEPTMINIDIDYDCAI